MKQKKREKQKTDSQSRLRRMRAIDARLDQLEEDSKLFQEFMEKTDTWMGRMIERLDKIIKTLRNAVMRR